LLRDNRFDFYSLQLGDGAEQLRQLPGEIRVIDFTEHIKDFADTAAFLAELDLVISADTAVVHLAGALARPVWTLLPFAPDWRWGLAGEDTPWYPTMRLFRQPAIADWESVVRRVSDELTHWQLPR
jgi:ADP-heptose:LPS heptosyltransferase